MKKFYMALLGVILVGTASAQLVIEEDFDEAGVIPADWIAVDEDMQPSNTPGQENWIVDTIGAGAFYEGRIFAISQSWLEGFAPGNRNWLISPAIDVASADYTYGWGGCPGQGTIYMDGYKVVLSTTGTDLADFTETLATYAQNINDTPGEFSDGIVHEAFVGDPTDGGNPASGVLVHNTVSLGDYVGETVYVAILHDSDDDFAYYLDYVQVGPAADVTSVDDLTGRTFNVNAYPNPATDIVTISAESNINGNITLDIFSPVGQLVDSKSVVLSGSETVTFNVSEYASGVYTARVNFGANVVEKRFVVE